MRNVDKDALIFVAGGGGFIGGHLVGDLLEGGYRRLRVVDIKPRERWFQVFQDADNRTHDLSQRDACFEDLRDADVVFNFACDMGGMGFIENNKALCMLSSLINTHLLLAAKEYGVSRYFYASSACVYAADKQDTVDVTPLKETDAYPAMPEDGYGWEKLFSERTCRHFAEDFDLTIRIGRYHNVYGPHGTYDGGREKAPAAICRKVIQAKRAGADEIEIWGDGKQTRSFMDIRDAIHGTKLVMDGDVEAPLNLGSDQLVTIDRLVDIIEGIAGVTLKRRYNLDAPKGVRGRNSDNTLIKETLGWAPGIRLEDGLAPTYAWIHDQIVGGGDSRQASAG